MYHEREESCSEHQEAGREDDRQDDDGGKRRGGTRCPRGGSEGDGSGVRELQAHGPLESGVPAAQARGAQRQGREGDHPFPQAGGRGGPPAPARETAHAPLRGAQGRRGRAGGRQDDIHRRQWQHLRHGGDPSPARADTPGEDHRAREEG